MKKKITALLILVLLLVLTISGCSTNSTQKESTVIDSANITVKKIVENGVYSKTEEVAEYIHTYHKLPSNYITKNDAIALGWDSDKGNLWKVTDKKSIGGDKFGNYEGLLPKKSGRQWYECDVNYQGGYRGSERILYSNDDLIYYTNDHYKTFKKLY